MSRGIVRFRLRDDCDDGRKEKSRRRQLGQGLVEFAIVAPMLFLLIGGIIQFGLIFWAQNTLTQIARDTGRWAATQTDCSAAGVTAEAKAIAANSTLFGYSGKLDVTTTWTDGSGNLWDGSGTCVPEDNQQVMFVNITIGHTVPIFFPLVPGNGDLSTTAQFRMEPEPA